MNEIACSVCGELKPETEFYMNGWIYRMRHCKVCHRKKQSVYHQEHREQDNERSKKWMVQNAEKMKRYYKSYWQEHIEEKRRNGRNWSKKKPTQKELVITPYGVP